MLPTDQRFKTLTEKQKELLFYGYLHLPDSELLKRAFASQSQQTLDEETKKDLHSVLGYSAEQVKWFENEIRKAYGHS